MGQLSEKSFHPDNLEHPAKSQVSLSRGCRLFGISRQAVYQAKQRAEERAKVLTQIKPLIQTARMQMPRLGTRKLYFLWKDHFDRMQKKNRQRCLIWIFTFRRMNSSLRSAILVEGFGV